MKKIVITSLIMLLVLSSVGVSSFTAKNTHQTTIQTTLVFGEPVITEYNDKTTITLPTATSSISTEGAYALPVVTQIYQLPFQSTIQKIDVTFSESSMCTLSKPLITVPAPQSDPTNQPSLSSETIVSKYTEESYLQQQYTYSVAGGRQGNQLVTYLVLRLYPLSYNSDDQTLQYVEHAEITIQYQPPDDPYILPETYDLLIIAPKQFVSILTPLVNHKTDMGVKTKLVTLSEIYDSTYFPVQGNDCAEEVKYFIKNALDEWGITYVLLAGGRKGGIMEETWWVPVRYSHLDDGGESSFLTDLYYADIYDDEGNFSSWDSNGNGIHAEWAGVTKDILDMVPEVYVGRFSCTTKFELKTVVQKIITYETTTYGSDWFNRFIGVAGDTYPEGDTFYEGEMANQAAFDYLTGFTETFLWTSTGTFTNKDDIISELSLGAGFAHFSGHGNPLAWGNHPPNNDTFIDGPSAFDMGKLKNGEKLPVVIVGGCHNAQFNTSLYNIIKGVLTDGLHYFSTESPNFGAFWFKEWIPQDWAWSMACKRTGGAIAVIANTGLGYGLPGPETLTARGRFMEVMFFRSYSEGKDVLGETHGSDLVYYMTTHPPMDNQIDCKIVQQWALLGDPSLKIGGYSS